ncbi:hypothetical protein WICPIJ_007157 [Wickerhamomyces pijperi]|uniref:Uncharacterized protein n=1 Tax=Wickerhamomyces pijperi TaxID=599730 RepID=A0A9P8Q0M8_WICPI|nr:hypothetical protein WICPIJ_007157 [Wickerhamomyces pijperi]
MNSQVKETSEQQQSQSTQVQQPVSVSVPVSVPDSTSLYIPGDKRKMSTSSSSPQDNKRTRLDNYQSTASASAAAAAAAAVADSAEPLTTVMSVSQVQAPSPTSPHSTHNLHHTHIPSKASPVKEDEEEEKLLVTPYQHLCRSNMVSTPTVDVKENEDQLCLAADLNDQQKVVSVSSDLLVLTQKPVTSSASSAATTAATATSTATTSTAGTSATTLSSAQQPAKIKKATTTARVGKLRSKSLPNIMFPSLCEDVNQKTIRLKTRTYQSKKTQQPPVNVQSLSEIDLTEITKNPQLRHDILFDPHLQFRPNLDGERGKRKKMSYDKYWNSIKIEIELFLSGNPEIYENSKIPTLFTTLKDILVTLLPSKDRQAVMDVMDVELITQQMVNKSLDFVALSHWLSEIFKAHCAPMRDAWADEMVCKFRESQEEKSVSKLVEGLRMVFTILEAMKLDVANHQIKLLRPSLIETAVEFERGYFQEIVSRGKLDISNSITWFRSFQKPQSDSQSPNSSMIDAILSLLSCSKMINEFPTTLIFDHSRLIMLRASVRQLVCLQLCTTLYRQLVFKHVTDPRSRMSLTGSDKLDSLKKEIIAIITDDNGNIKWTRNISDIALHLATKATGKADEQVVEFGFSWLIKQTQPSSPVYALMESRVFAEIKNAVLQDVSSDISLEKLTKLANQIPLSKSTATTATTGLVVSLPEKQPETNEDVQNVAHRVALLTKFHLAVFNQYYYYQ